MPSKTLPIEMAPQVAFTSLAPARKVVVSGRGAFDCYAADVVMNRQGMHTFQMEQRSRSVLPRLASLDRQLGV
jgi:hypothetical protein